MRGTYRVRYEIRRWAARALDRAERHAGGQLKNKMSGRRAGDIPGDLLQYETGQRRAKLQTLYRDGETVENRAAALSLTVD